MLSSARAQPGLDADILGSDAALAALRDRRDTSVHVLAFVVVFIAGLLGLARFLGG